MFYCFFFFSFLLLFLFCLLRDLMIQTDLALALTKDGLELPTVPPVPRRCKSLTSVPPYLVYTVLGAQPRAACLLGKHC